MLATSDSDDLFDEFARENEEPDFEWCSNRAEVSRRASDLPLFLRQTFTQMAESREHTRFWLNYRGYVEYGRQGNLRCLVRFPAGIQEHRRFLLAAARDEDSADRPIAVHWFLLETGFGSLEPGGLFGFVSITGETAIITYTGGRSFHDATLLLGDGEPHVFARIQDFGEAVFCQCYIISF